MEHSYEPLRAAITQYFQGEKFAGTLALPLGIAFAAAGAWIFWRESSLRAASWPLWVGAIAMIGIGVVLMMRSDGQASAMIARLEPGAVATETARVERVLRTFTMLKILWCVLIVAAAFSTYLFDRPFVRPLAVGIAADAAAVLLFDMIADGRARVYLTALRAASSA